MRAVIKFYTESAVSSRRILETTAPQIEEKLNRVFDTLTAEYGVVMTDSAITGLSPVILQRWFNAAAQNWKPATANNYVCLLNPFLRWAFSMEIMEKDLSQVLHSAKLPSPDELPEDQRPKDKYYDHEQVYALLNEVGGRNLKRDRAIMALILYGGFRVSEVCGLTIGQVMDVQHGSVRLRRKGGAWKDAPIAEDVYPFLEAYLKTRSDTANRNAPLFVTTHGQPCTRQQLYKAISGKQKVLNLATGPHALRHTAISEVSNRFGAAVARDFANHKSFTVTNRYAHTSARQRQDAVNGLDWN